MPVHVVTPGSSSRAHKRTRTLKYNAKRTLFAAPTAMTTVNTGEPNPVPVPRAVSVYWPDRFNIRLRYADNFQFHDTDGTTAVMKQQYRLNSVYDVDYTNVGHQPNGFDKWAAIYKWYRVMGCTVTVSCHKPSNISGNPAAPVVVGWYFDAGGVLVGSSPLQWENIAEMKERHFENLGWGDDNAYFQFNYTQDKTGDKAIVEATKEMIWTNISSNPTVPDVLTIFAAPLKTNDHVWADMSVFIEFEVQFADAITNYISDFMQKD